MSDIPFCDLPSSVQDQMMADAEERRRQESDKNTGLKNTTPLEFTPLEDEWREYVFAAESGKPISIVIHQPRFLNVNPVHGAHRVLDSHGGCHYIPNRFIAIRWQVPGEAEHFHTTVTQPSGEKQQTRHA